MFCDTINSQNNYTPRRGETIALGQLTFEVLHSDEDMEEYSLNNASIVLKLAYGGISFLFTGDIGQLNKGFEIGEHNVLEIKSNWVQVIIDRIEYTITGWVNKDTSVMTTKVDGNRNFVYQNISYKKLNDMVEISGDKKIILSRITN